MTRNHHQIFECAHLKFTESGRSKQTYKHRYTHPQCSHASVGLAQAPPNKSGEIVIVKVWACDTKSMDMWYLATYTSGWNLQTINIRSWVSNVLHLVCLHLLHIPLNLFCYQTLTHIHKTQNTSPMYHKVDATWLELHLDHIAFGHVFKCPILPHNFQESNFNACCLGWDLLLGPFSLTVFSLRVSRLLKRNPRVQ